MQFFEVLHIYSDACALGAMRAIKPGSGKEDTTTKVHWQQANRKLAK
jgi:hypothetical protein